MHVAGEPAERWRCGGAWGMCTAHAFAGSSDTAYLVALPVQHYCHLAGGGRGHEKAGRSSLLFNEFRFTSTYGIGASGDEHKDRYRDRLGLPACHFPEDLCAAAPTDWRSGRLAVANKA